MDHRLLIDACHNLRTAAEIIKPCVNFDLADWNIIYQNLPKWRGPTQKRA